MDPVSILSICNLQITDSIADFGAGSGFVAKAAASIVTQGNVFAIEINKDIVTRLTREIDQMKITNIHPIWGDIEVNEGTKLSNDSMDFVILSNVMFHLDDKVGCIKEAYRVLKTGGRIIMIDWSESFGGMGPSKDSVFSKESAIKLFSSIGFSTMNESIEAGDHHYAILFKK